MEKPPKPASALSKKRKRKSSNSIGASQAKNIKVEVPKIQKNNKESPKTPVLKANNVLIQKSPAEKVISNDTISAEIEQKYPVLKDKELIEKFLKVPLNNNQKGRIRQAIHLQLKGTTDNLKPDVIHGKIQAILKSSENLTDSQLRRIRILYNMLNTSVTVPKLENATPKPKKEKKKIIKEESKKINKEENKKINKEENKKINKEENNKIKTEDKDSVTETEKKDKKEQVVNKGKGPKRYVVFIGNLPLDIDKEKLMEHFSEMNEFIKDVRIPEPAEGKKSAIAYLELSNEPSYELALSKHHSMLGNKRIKVLYSLQKNTKMSKAEAKSKSAKLIALQKSGKLLGSVPLAKKRSQRRMKMKQARAKAAAE